MKKWKVIASLIATMSTTIFSTVKVLPQVNSATIVRDVVVIMRIICMMTTKRQYLLREVEKCGMD